MKAAAFRAIIAASRAMLTTFRTSEVASNPLLTSIIFAVSIEVVAMMGCLLCVLGIRV
jgi:hypothetical protein